MYLLLLLLLLPLDPAELGTVSLLRLSDLGLHQVQGAAQVVAPDVHHGALVQQERDRRLAPRKKKKLS